MSQKAAFAQLGKNIAARRRALALTQAELAEALMVDTETLARFERGRHAPSLRTLAKLSAVLSVPAGELLGDKPLPEANESLQVAAWLAQLGASDRALMVELIRLQCATFRSRARGRHGKR
jgi:transcriptional regulator with XRE-family HTH domain